MWGSPWCSGLGVGQETKKLPVQTQRAAPVGIPVNGRLNAIPKEVPSHPVSLLCGKQRNPYFG